MVTLPHNSRAHWVPNSDTPFIDTDFLLRDELAGGSADLTSSSLSIDGLEGIIPDELNVSVGTSFWFTNPAFLAGMHEPCSLSFSNCLLIQDTKRFSWASTSSAHLFFVLSGSWLNNRMLLRYNYTINLLWFLTLATFSLMTKIKHGFRDASNFSNRSYWFGCKCSPKR